MKIARAAKDAAVHVATHRAPSEGETDEIPETQEGPETQEAPETQAAR
jgi:hypothetical protein